MDYVETYFKEMRDTHLLNAAADELGFYAPLGKLLNEISRAGKLKVQCVMGLRNQGVGLPDGGFFTAEQTRRKGFEENIVSQIPARGVMEVKSPADDVEAIAEGEQVARYLTNYGTVLVTNYRDFLLVKQDPDGRLVKAERYTISESEQQFWRDVTHPRALAAKHSQRLSEFLTRVMLHNAPLAEPKQLAWFLASYARDARIRIEAAEDLTALDNVRSALEEALGLKFEGEKGEHFFRSTLVQTLFYGLFSAWVLWAKEHGSESRARFEWHMAQWSLHVPMISALFAQLVIPTHVRALGLEEVMEWAGDALNRVDRGPFFARFEESQAVQYFYEPFLEAFDPELRKELGVWYTPPEIVKYMVERVDTVLRAELDIHDGLADPNVYVLDPCCGTGAYLVEVLRRIEKTLRERGEDALIGNDVKRAAVNRVFGFEILPAPFVVSHLQLGLVLQNLGAPLSDERNERAGVYLTNALTGWEPPTGPKQTLSFHEMEEERDAADEVKREKPILVVLGNPPYNAFAGVSPAEEKGLVEPYKEGLISEWGIKKFNLDDLYIRFFRLAERRIAEISRKGVVAFISNHSWVSDPSYVVLRKHLMGAFDKLWIENMHGNRQMSEYAPDGRTSETIFAIPGFSVGIQQGVVISTWLKTGEDSGEFTVLFRDSLNAAKASDRRAQLIHSLETDDFNSAYEYSQPARDNRLSFRPWDIPDDYKQWPALSSISKCIPFPALMESRHGALMDIDKAVIQQRLTMYLARHVEWEVIQAEGHGLTIASSTFSPRTTREKILRVESYDEKNVKRYLVRPMEMRWSYISATPQLWHRSRPALLAQDFEGNEFIVTRMKTEKLPKGSPMYYSRFLADCQAITRNVSMIPFRLMSVGNNGRVAGQHTLDIELANEQVTHANLSAKSRTYLATLGITNPDADAETAGLIWMHALAIGYSPAYLEENADGIRQDWPRIPLPDSKDLLLKSAELGCGIAALLDTETEVDGVTAGTIPPELRLIGPISAVAGETLDPDAGDLAVTAGWGHAGKGGVTMPGKGRSQQRAYSTEERDQMGEAAQALGENTLDIYINDRAYWKNVPERVWNYHIGGYQVMKKWLSYREKPLLGRPLKPEEAREVTNMARRIAAILLLEPELDANYEQAKASCYPWPAD